MSGQGGWCKHVELATGMASELTVLGRTDSKCTGRGSFEGNADKRVRTHSGDGRPRQRVRHQWVRAPSAAGPSSGSGCI